MTISGLQGRNIDRLMNAIFAVEKKWNTHISTARLNRWLAGMIEGHPPPAVSGRRLKMRYMTQAKMRPPSFILFASRPEALPASYLRYLVNGLRDAFDMPGTPIRLWVRGGKNPFVQERRQGSLGCACVIAYSLLARRVAITIPPKRPDAECGAA